MDNFFGAVSKRISRLRVGTTLDTGKVFTNQKVLGATMGVIFESASRYQI
jgi:hypothetical protein